MKTLAIAFILVIFSGCVDRGSIALFPSDSHLDYKSTGFKSSHQRVGRLLVRPVRDSRRQYEGQNIAGKKAKITDASFHRNMAVEFETILLKELRESGIFQEVLLTEEAATANDHVLMIDLQVLFSEVKGFMITVAGSVIQFNSVLSRNDKRIFEQSFSATGGEFERGAGGLISTVADSLDDVASIAIRKAMRNLLEKMDAVP